MGTDVVVLAPPTRIDDGVEVVGRLFENWDRRLSRFDVDSELSRLNGMAGSPFLADDLLFDVLLAALAAARASRGLFDPTVAGRLVALGYDATFEALPADRVAAPLPPWRAGAWTDIAVDRASRSITMPRGLTVDLGGVAKGMAVDAALEAAMSQGIGPVAINAGGDIAVEGRVEGGWPIRLDDADRTVVIRDGALATSSVLRRRWQVNGQHMHHLIDPRTGQPARGDLASVTVAASSCRAAEVAAKSALLLGSEAAETWLVTHRLAAVLVLGSGEVRNVGERRTAA